MQEDTAGEEETEATEANASNVQGRQDLDGAVPGNLRNDLADWWYQVEPRERLPRGSLRV